jgi:membrane-associated protein
VSVSHIVASLGTAGIIGIIFAETGLLIGFFLPGDSLLVAAGAFAAPGRHLVGGTNVHLNLGVLLVGCFVAAAVGAQLGYLFGAKAGPPLFARPNSRLFKPEYVVRANQYFDHYGNVTVVLARFIPVVRTFANPVAGASRMKPWAFAAYNIAGAMLWTTLVLLLGYFVGNSVKDTYLIPAVIVVSFIPIGIEFLRQRRHAAAVAASATDAP